MKKLLDVLGKICIFVLIAALIFNVLAFAATDEIKYGIWAILISVSMHVSGNIEISVKER